MIAANIRPSEKTIADKLNELKSKEMSLISANEILYRRVTKNMDNLVVDPFFYNEQVDLFMDRKIFFYETYGAIGEDVDVNKWTDGFQDVMGNDGTIPYQLVKNFDQIILKSLSINCHPFCKNFKPVYFERQWELFCEVNDLFNNYVEDELFLQKSLPSSYFENLANIIVLTWEQKTSKAFRTIDNEGIFKNGTILGKSP